MKNIIKKVITFITVSVMLVIVFGNFVQAMMAETEYQTEKQYTVLIEQPEHGTFRLNKSEEFYKAGESVSFVAEPESGFYLEELQVITESKKEIEAAEKKMSFHFIMPSENVIIKASFTKKESKAAEKEQTEAVTEKSKSALTAKSKPDDNYKKTFRVENTGGILRIMDINNKLLAEIAAGQEKTFESMEYPEGLRVQAVADKDFYVAAYKTKILLSDGSLYETPDSLYALNKEVYKRGHYLSLDADEVFEVSFSKEKSTNPKTVSASPRAGGDADNPVVGDEFTGRASVVYHGYPNVSYNGTGYINCTSGAFEGDAITLSTCISGHDFACPATGQTGSYTIKVTSISDHVVTCYVTWINDFNSSGYQNLAGFYSYGISPEGELIVFKDMYDTSNFICPYDFHKDVDLQAVFGVYADEKTNTKVGQIKTDKKGSPVKDGLELDAGTYYVKEITAPVGFALNDTVKKVKIGSGASKSITIKDRILRAKVDAVKIDGKTGLAEPFQGLSLAGARYGVYGDKACTKLICEGTTNAKGVIDFGSTYFVYGTYYIKEIEAPPGYRLDTTVYTVTVDKTLGYYSGDNEYRLKDMEIVLENSPDTGFAKVKKVSANPGITQGNHCYSLEGAAFKLTRMSDGYEVPERLITNASGESQELEVVAGRYYIEEEKAPLGFLLHDEKFIIEVESNKLAVLEIENKPIFTFIELLLRKIDSETAEEVPQGAAVFEGAEYTFQYFDGYYSSETELQGIHPLKVWTLATDRTGKILFDSAERVSGDDFYTDNGKRVMPLGTVVIQETKAPKGYKEDPVIYMETITAESETGRIIRSYQTAVSPEQIIRGDLKGVKISGGDMKRMANIPFRITSLTTRESHTILTDQNGEFNTSSAWNPHSRNTNRGESSEDGIWFGEPEALDDDKGALIYDTYLIEELPCDANADRILFAPFEVVISRDMTVIDLGTLTNIYSLEPLIGTTAMDRETGEHYGYINEFTTIVDEVRFENLIPGREYTLKGKLMDKQSAEPFVINDKEITAEVMFVPIKENGSAELEFNLDSRLLHGKEIVVYEYLYLEKEEVTKHTEITDRGQTVEFYDPGIHTTAFDKETGEDIGFAYESTVLTDLITYKNLIPQKEYTVKGILMDKSTGEPLLTDGQKITSEKTFTPAKADGSIELEFTFHALALKNNEIVVFESLFYNEREIAVHADINDSGQTVKYQKPKLKTTASEKATGKKEITAADKVTLIDNIKYQDLIPGKRYKIKGQLMDKNTGKNALVKGQKITAEKTFRAPKKSGSVQVAFTVDASELAGKEMVVFETLYYNNKKIAKHQDIHDKAQTVKFKAADQPAEVVPRTPENGVAKNGPKTGDNNPLGIYIAITAVSVLTFLFAFKKRFLKLKK